MLGQIRNTRVGGKTAAFVLVLTLVFFGAFMYGNIIDFVPVEFLEPVDAEKLNEPLPDMERVAVPQDGALPVRWAAGLDCSREAPFQVHDYGNDFYVIRQSKCVNYEAPFLFLFIGDEQALLMDTGAVPEADVYGEVMRVLEARAARAGTAPPPPAVPLVVAHTHSHGDHTAADDRFRNAPGVAAVVELSLDEVEDFWGFTDWPHDTPVLDLGNRVLDVIAIPGHHRTSIALYDRRTQVLLTGDSVYPGHLFVPSAEAWPDVVASLDRLVAFAAANPVAWVLGNHIEVSAEPYTPYEYGTAAHPDERALHLPPTRLQEIARAAHGMGDTPRCEVYEDYVVQPTYVCGFDWNG
jgi:hydroxyacylglutathione hydrolase